MMLIKETIVNMIFQKVVIRKPAKHEKIYSNIQSHQTRMGILLKSNLEFWIYISIAIHIQIFITKFWNFYINRKYSYDHNLKHLQLSNTATA